MKKRQSSTFWIWTESATKPCPVVGGYLVLFLILGDDFDDLVLDCIVMAIKLVILALEGNVCQAVVI